MAKVMVVQVNVEDVHPGRKVIQVNPDGSETSYPVINKGDMRLAIVPEEQLATFLEVFDWTPGK